LGVHTGGGKTWTRRQFRTGEGLPEKKICAELPAGYELIKKSANSGERGGGGHLYGIYAKLWTKRDKPVRCSELERMKNFFPAKT